MTTNTAIFSRASSFALAMLAFACGPSNDDLRAKLDNRARFDLGCRDIHVAPLEETNGYVVSYGVTGCGKRVTYVLNGTTLGWMMNVADGEPTGQSPGEAPRSPPPPPPLPHPR